MRRVALRLEGKTIVKERILSSAKFSFPRCHSSWPDAPSGAGALTWSMYSSIPPATIELDSAAYLRKEGGKGRVSPSSKQVPYLSSAQGPGSTGM